MHKAKFQNSSPPAPYAVDVGVLLSKRHDQLERRVQQRTAEQTQVNEALVTEILARQAVEEALRQSQKQLSELIEHQAQIKEDERKRIAREIHDELGQNLLALRIDISRLHERTGDAHPCLHKLTGVALANVDATIKSVKAIINNLRPFILELGLQAAAAWQLAEFARITGIQYRLINNDPDATCALDDEQTLAAFRILQESLTNITRHAHAAKIEVELGSSNHGKTFYLRVADDGVGMTPADAGKPKSFGLAGIRERLHAFDGRLTIESAPGLGTTVKAALPLRGTMQKSAGAEMRA